MRATVLAAWAASPARFREDANAEELLALGYGGRVLAELAANAADAAREAGVPGELLITLADRQLCVANTGRPLDAAGVAALASLRASAKRDGVGIGHFGVGFTAVRALTDEPQISSTTGAIAFSVTETARAVTDLGSAELDAELARRDGTLPALRLPRAVRAAPPPAGYATEVRLPLRADIDVDALAASLTVEAATDLIWALPELRSVTIPGLTVRRVDAVVTDPAPEVAAAAGPVSDTAAVDAGPGGPAAGVIGAVGPGIAEITVINLPAPAIRQSYRVREAAGTIPAPLLADRPVEERARDRWRLTWVLPLPADGAPDRSAIGAPTPTGELLGLPARLIATLPVDETRDRIATGPLTDYLIEAAADAYVDLVRSAPAGERIRLLPPTGFPLGPVDGLLREAISRRLADSAVLVDAAGSAVRPSEATVVPGLTGAAAAAVAEALPGLLPYPAESLARLRALGVRQAGIDVATAALAGLDRPVDFWRRLYDGLADFAADDLVDLPVPRAGGGTIIGPRGVLLPADSGWADRAAALIPGLRLAVRGIDHPLLRRLGARPAEAADILADPLLAAEIERRYEGEGTFGDGPFGGGSFGDGSFDGGPFAFARLICDLLAAGAGDSAVLGRVLLTDEDGEPCPAEELLLPDAPLAAVLAEDVEMPVVGARWITEYGPDCLRMLGVRSGFAVTRQPLPPGVDSDLPDVQRWWEEQAEGYVADTSFTAVRDLDYVAADRWPAALAMIAADQEGREALRPTASGPSYTTWWLSRYAEIDGVALRRWRAADAAELAGLYDALPAGTVPVAGMGASTDIGVLRTLAEAAAEPAELIGRWADPDRPLPPWRVAEVTAAVVDALDGSAAGADIELPPRVRVLSGDVVDAGRAAVLDHPMFAAVIAADRLVSGGADPARTADLLDLPLVSEVYRFSVDPEAGETRCALADLAPGAGAVGARSAVLQEGLTVRSDTGTAVRVRWWIDDGELYLDGSAEGTGRAIAYLSGCWADRHRLVALARADAMEIAEGGFSSR